MVGDHVLYYAVDHSPSYLWDAATWEISEALLPFLPTVMGGPEAWDANPTIRRAIEIRDGVIQNPAILSFQGRSAKHPHLAARDLTGLRGAGRGAEDGARSRLAGRTDRLLASSSVLAGTMLGRVRLGHRVEVGPAGVLFAAIAVSAIGVANGVKLQIPENVGTGSDSCSFDRTRSGSSRARASSRPCRRGWPVMLTVVATDRRRRGRSRAGGPGPAG